MAPCTTLALDFSDPVAQSIAISVSVAASCGALGGGDKEHAADESRFRAALASAQAAGLFVAVDLCGQTLDERRATARALTRSQVSSLSLSLF